MAGEPDQYSGQNLCVNRDDPGTEQPFPVSSRVLIVGEVISSSSSIGADEVCS
jgi:hypothetical protein